MVFSTNQAKQLYVATTLYTSSGDPSTLKNIKFFSDGDGGFYAKYVGNDGLVRTDIIKANQIAYAKGVGCGMLMSLATYQKTPLWVTVMAVATFILAGFNHCIADFYYMLTGGIFSWNLLLTILGNIIGGLFLSPQRLHSNT